MNIFSNQYFSYQMISELLRKQTQRDRNPERKVFEIFQPKLFRQRLFSMFFLSSKRQTQKTIFSAMTSNNLM